MNYIVLDAEFNGRIFKSNKPMEIIELGAIKLNENLEVIHTFSTVIKPKYFKKNKFIQEFTGISQSEINEAFDFPFVYNAFKQFCGREDFIFVTWGMDDVEKLIRDSRFHYLDNEWINKPFVNLMYNIKLLSNKSSDIGLMAAIQEIGLEWEGDRHRAIDDAINTMKLFKHYIDIIPNITTSNPFEKNQLAHLSPDE